MPLRPNPGNCKIGAAFKGMPNGHANVTWEVTVPAFDSQEFLVGLAVAGILLSALVVSSLFRNVAFALAAGAIVLLYVQGGVPGLIATSKVVESEFRSIPEFSRGLMVGLAMAAVFLLGIRQRSSSS